MWIIMDPDKLLSKRYTSEPMTRHADKEIKAVKTMLTKGSRAIVAIAGAGISGLLALVRLLADAAETTPIDDDRRLHDSDIVGELNYRTGRLDAGTDPYGWYDEE